MIDLSTKPADRNELLQHALMRLNDARAYEVRARSELARKPEDLWMRDRLEEHIASAVLQQRAALAQIRELATP